MSPVRAGAVVHKNVAIIACDAPGTLMETRTRLADLEVDAVVIGERHLAMPASQLAAVLERLRESGQFPRLLGEAADVERLKPHPLEEE